MRTAFRLTGTLDVRALGAALAALGRAETAWRLTSLGSDEHRLDLDGAAPAGLADAYAAARAGRAITPPASAPAGGAPRYTLELAADHPRSASLAARVAEARFAPLPGGRDTVLAAFLVLLGRYTGRRHSGGCPST
ncbi:MAG TPA: hypothetical protein VL738_15665 [Dactylosporangium sp.]|jgi:hypothetical protein|nr:hypothetical protein [Dactylosporangium sp.]